MVTCHPTRGGSVRIEVRGRNTEVTDELRRHVEKRFKRIGRQVSEYAVLEVELTEEKNPRIADSEVVEATLHLKRATLRAREASPEMLHSIHVVAEDLRRQVKRHRQAPQADRDAAVRREPAPGHGVGREPAAGRYPQNPWPRDS
jgi:putative sigma-54 modulation protein